MQTRRISFAEVQTADLVRMVRDGSIDVAILSTPLKERGVTEVEVYSEPFFLAVDRAHPLAERRRVHISDLKSEKLLLLGEGHCLRNQALSLCKLSQAGGDADMSATSIEALRSMVAMGAGITLIPQLALRKEEGVRYIPFDERSMHRKIGVLYRSTYRDVKFIEELVGVIREAARREQLPVIERTT